MNTAYIVCLCGYGLHTVLEFLGAYSSYNKAVQEICDYSRYHRFRLSEMGNYASGFDNNGRFVCLKIAYVPFRG